MRLRHQAVRRAPILIARDFDRSRNAPFDQLFVVTGRRDQYRDHDDHRKDGEQDGHLVVRRSATIAARTASNGELIRSVCSTAKNRRFALPSIGEDQA